LRERDELADPWKDRAGCFLRVGLPELGYRLSDATASRILRDCIPSPQQSFRIAVNIVVDELGAVLAKPNAIIEVPALLWREQGCSVAPSAALVMCAATPMLIAFAASSRGSAVGAGSQDLSKCSQPELPRYVHVLREVVTHCFDPAPLTLSLPETLMKSAFASTGARHTPRVKTAWWLPAARSSRGACGWGVSGRSWPTRRTPTQRRPRSGRPTSVAAVPHEPPYLRRVAMPERARG